MHLAQKADRIGHMLEKEDLVKLFLCITKHNTNNIYVDMEAWVHVFLNSAPDGSGQPHAPTALTPEKAPPVSIRYLAG
jgi:hypothetical protein